MPNRRPSQTFEFHHEGLRYIGSVGYDDTDAPAEVFLSTGKPGAAVSLALQHGTPLATLRRANGRAWTMEALQDP